MLPASFAACVPVFIATPTSACARAGASLVPSPVIATSRPPACCSRIRASLASGVASARKSSTPASAAIAAAVSGLSPVIITVLMPIGAQLGEALADAALDDVLELDDAERLGAVGDDERRAAARARSSSTIGVELAAGTGRPVLRRTARSASAAPLRMPRPSDVDAAHARLRGERDERRARARRAGARGGRTAPSRARRCSGPRASRRRATRAARPRRARARRRPATGMKPPPAGCRA